MHHVKQSAAPATSALRPVLRATALLGGSSAASLVIGMLSTKVGASILGPSGLGFLGLLQNLVSLAVLVAGLGVGTGLVRDGASALLRQDEPGVAALRRAAWLLFWLTGGLAALLLALCGGPISELLLASREHGGTVATIAPAVLLTMATAIQTDTLNAYHRVGALARLGLFSSLLGAATSLPLLWFWREQGIVPSVVALASSSWLVSFLLARTELPRPTQRPSLCEVIQASLKLLRFGAPFTASSLAGVGIQLAIPFLVLHTLDSQGVGFYRAASLISLGALMFLLKSLAQDYYPRISALGDQPGEVNRLVNQQHRLVLLLVTPMILALLALAPHLLPLLYAPEFAPATEILQWQLVGDVLKFASWTISYAILARCGSTTFLVTEVIGGLVTLAAHWIGMRWFGLPGLGIGFLASYLVYYLLVWAVLRRSIGFTLSRENALLLLTALSATLATVLPTLLGRAELHTLLGLSMSAVAGAFGLYLLRREVTGARRPLSPSPVRMVGAGPA